MLLIQSLSSGRMTAAWRVVGCLGLAAVLAGCATSGADVASTAAPAAVDDSAIAEAAPQITATEAAVASNPEGAPSEAAAPADRPVVNATAPTEYTVKRGDTLWDIAALFLRDPWLWPEIWQVNQQVKNPHLIYPGDVLALAYAANGDPQVRLARGGGARLDPLLRSSALDGAIATIPYSAIAAFLERPTVLSKEQVKDAPRVLAFRNEHMIGGAGIEAYIRGLSGAQQNSRYSVVHIGDEIRDPDDGDVIGYQGTYTATAVIVNPGETAKAALTDSARETLEGDRLFGGDSEVPLNFMPRSPGREISGQIVSVIDGVTVIGQYKIVAINRGRRHGLEPGHVLAIDEAGLEVRDRNASRIAGMKLGSAFAPRVQLPNERNGTLLVFRVFDRMSYGLIVSASNSVRIADVVRTPY